MASNLQEKFCCCIPLWVGVMIIGIFIGLELLGTIGYYLFLYRDNYAWINILFKIMLVAFFIWMAICPQNIKARAAALLGLFIDLIIYLIMLMITLYTFFFSDYFKHRCINLANENKWVVANDILYT